MGVRGNFEKLDAFSCFLNDFKNDIECLTKFIIVLHNLKIFTNLNKYAIYEKCKLIIVRCANIYLISTIKRFYIIRYIFRVLLQIGVIP